MRINAGRKCALCGHPEDFGRCGSGEVTTGSGVLWLCHTDDHSCYHRWTVYGARPAVVPVPPTAPDAPPPRPIGAPLWVGSTVFDVCPRCSHPGPHPATGNIRRPTLQCEVDAHRWQFVGS